MSAVSSDKLKFASRAERLARGKALRQRVPRSAHARWKPADDRPHVVALLKASNRGRLPELVPIRHARMLASPFNFYRGSAAAMAFDLAATPNSGIQVQLGGDCHLMNFGGFATPERNFIFDLTDFDETLPGPWEWDVKRLAASVFVAGRSIGVPDRECKDAARGSVASYRQHMYELSCMHPLDVWYARIDGTALLELMSEAIPRRHEHFLGQTSAQQAETLLPKLTEVVDGRRHFRDNPPLVFHTANGERFEQEMHRFLARYRETLQEDRRTLLDRFRVADVAMKVVSVGSVGRRCAIVLLVDADDDGVILQYKEADRSVLERFLGKSKHGNHAQRVVHGQRLLQSASDMFLGWASDEDGRDFYFRQLRDMKTTVRIDGVSGLVLAKYAALCGQTLARAHAKAGDAASISGYLGKSEAFDRAVAQFAHAYANQTERDYREMVRAVRKGRLTVEYQDPP